MRIPFALAATMPATATTQNSWPATQEGDNQESIVVSSVVFIFFPLNGTSYSNRDDESVGMKASLDCGACALRMGEITIWDNEWNILYYHFELWMRQLLCTYFHLFLSADSEDLSFEKYAQFYFLIKLTLSFNQKGEFLKKFKTEHQQF